MIKVKKKLMLRNKFGNFNVRIMIIDNLLCKFKL